MAKPQVNVFLQRLDRELDSLASQSQLRHLSAEGTAPAGANSGEINLCSNDYLGLACDSRLRDAVAAALSAGSPVGSTGSRLLSGNAAIWEELESELARFFDAEAVLYFNSGYAANVGLLSAVLGPEDVVFSDRANHASIIDGIRLSGAHKMIFPHLDLDFLEAELRKEDERHKPAASAQKVIVVETIFSMDGDLAPVGDLVALAGRYGAQLIFDEAHATGVAGPQGRGLVAAAAPLPAENVLAVVHTCGKALAGMGAFICCSDTLKQYLVNRARTFIFSTALPPYMAAQMRAAIHVAAAADERRSHLASLGSHLRARLRDAGFDTGRSESQIIPVLLGHNQRALDFAGELCRLGFVVRAIRPPTVPEGAARLRVSLHTGLSTQMLDRFVEGLIHVREDATHRTALAASAVR